MEQPRVRIRPVTDDDLPHIEKWYEEAARQVRGGIAGSGAQNLVYQLEEARASGSGDLLAIERPEEPGPIGLLDYRAGEPEEGWLTFGYVAMAAGQRGRGYGSEAVRLVESETAAGRFRAAVDAANGLGLYFWLRLGYRRSHSGEFGWPAGNGIIWMVREGVEDQEPKNPEPGGSGRSEVGPRRCRTYSAT